MTQIAIETATQDDVADICLLLEILFLQEADFTPDIQKQRSAIKHLITHPEQGHFLVLRLDYKIIGCVSLLYLTSTAEGGKVALLEDMIIAPEHRHHGYGKKLLKRAVEFAHAQGCLRVTLLTDRDNAKAQNFYQQQGFKASAMMPMRLKFEK